MCIRCAAAAPASFCSWPPGEPVRAWPALIARLELEQLHIDQCAAVRRQRICCYSR